MKPGKRCVSAEALQRLVLADLVTPHSKKAGKAGTMHSGGHAQVLHRGRKVEGDGPHHTRGSWSMFGA